MMNTGRFLTAVGVVLLGCSALIFPVNAFYNPQPGRWLNRDPINEPGFKLLTDIWQDFDHEEEKNLHVFVRNNAVSFYDPLGNCFCLFKGNIGKLTVDPSCLGVLAIWVIDEGNAPAAGATTGITVSADGYVLNGTMYKIDGSTCVTLKCDENGVIEETCVNFIASWCYGKKPPYAVPPGSLGVPPKEPPLGSIPPLAK